MTPRQFQDDILDTNYIWLPKESACLVLAPTCLNERSQRGLFCQNLPDLMASNRIGIGRASEGAFNKTCQIQFVNRKTVVAPLTRRHDWQIVREWLVK
jgi:hypothetical protein